MSRVFLITCFTLVFVITGFGQDLGDKKPIQGIGNGNGQGSGIGNGAGLGSGTGTGNGSSVNVIFGPAPDLPITPKTNRGIYILSKPRPEYTDRARQQQVQGRVILRVTFKKNGEIGRIKVVSRLPEGLTQNAIKATRGIKFSPAVKNGKPVTVTKNLEYTFTVY